MVTAWQQDRRRKQAAQLKSESVAGLEALLGGIGGIADEQQRQSKDAQTAEERKRKAALDEAEVARRTAQDAATAEERKAAGVERAAREAERVLRQKGEATANEAKAAVLRRKASEDTLRARLEAGTPGATPIIDDPALGELDDDAVRTIEAEVAAKKAADGEKKRAADAKIAADVALAKQRSAPRAGPRPMSQTQKDIEDAKRRKALAEATIAEREAGGGVGPDGVAKPKTTPLPAEAAKERSLKVTGLELVQKLRTAKGKVGTGPIEGPLADAASLFKQNPERREFLQLNNAVQRVIGRILEGGKLAEGDARNYERFILDPNGLDDEEYNAILDSVEEQLRTDLTNFDAEMTSSGRAVGAPAPASNRTAPAPAKAKTGDNEIDDLPDA